MSLIDEIEYLALKLDSLREAEDLAAQAQPGMLSELRKLHYAALRRLNMLARRILKGRA
jgi:hypothetical protein